MPKRKPLVLISANKLEFTGTKAHIVRETYVDPVVQICDADVLMIPAEPAAVDVSYLMSIADGFVLTGSPSHVNPVCYGGKQDFEDKFIDSSRDNTTLPLLQAAIKADKPLFAICRGFQELNVACGGTLHQYVHKLPGMRDHRPKENLSTMESYHLRAHTVTTQPNGVFEKIGMPKEFFVNTIHTQGADKIGTGLHVEAIADDGLVEAISIPDKKFIVGVQWHPEGECDISESARLLFKTFGDSLRSK